MQIDFEAKMSTKTNDELLDLITERKRYVPDAINAAVSELQKRGHSFAVDELDNIQVDIALKMKSQYPEESAEYTYSSDMAIFPEKELPVYFSKKAIIGFSVLLSTLFGAVLLAINVRKNKGHLIIVLLFGVIFTVLVGYIQSLMPEKASPLAYLLNAIGGFILIGVFWPAFIGKDVAYRKREIWLPVIIAVAITLFYVFFILM